MEATLEIRNDAESTLRELFATLLEQNICHALMLPVQLSAGGGVAPALVRDRDRLADARPLAPVLPVSEATTAARLTRGDRQGVLGLLMHPCQLRAFVELVKLQQAERENVLLIGIDCPGTYELTDYVKLAREMSEPGEDLLPELRQGQPQPHTGYGFRAACQVCEWPFPAQADLHVRIVGVGSKAELVLQGRSELLEALGFTPAADSAGLSEAEETLLRERRTRRDEVFAAFSAGVHDMAGLLEYFATCIRCLNCMGACPLCYCKECIFRTDTFQHRPADYERWMERKGAVRLPADTLLFHLTRLNHMVTSCVGCGLCDSACPSDLPVARVFRTVGQRVQGLFDYVPGRDIAEPIPIATFREDELE